MQGEQPAALPRLKGSFLVDSILFSSHIIRSATTSARWSCDCDLLNTKALIVNISAIRANPLTFPVLLGTTWDPKCLQVLNVRAAMPTETVNPQPCSSSSPSSMPRRTSVSAPQRRTGSAPQRQRLLHRRRHRQRFRHSQRHAEQWPSRCGSATAR